MTSKVEIIWVGAIRVKAYGFIESAPFGNTTKSCVIPPNPGWARYSSSPPERHWNVRKLRDPIASSRRIKKVRCGPENSQDTFRSIDSHLRLRRYVRLSYALRLVRLCVRARHLTYDGADRNSRSLLRRLWHPCRIVQHPKVLPRIAEASLPPARIFKSLPPPGQRSFASGSTNNRYSRQQLLLHRRISSLCPLAVFAHYPPKYVSPGPPVQPRPTPPDASPASHCTPVLAPGQR